MEVRIGLTGSIGAGKSTVSALLRARGFCVLDADEVAREVVSSPDTLAQLEREFPGVVRGGILDRAALGKGVFSDPEKLARLNAITHPRIRARLSELERRARAEGTRHTVSDIPLLFETGQASAFDAVLLVDAPLEVRVKRVMRRNGLSRAEVLARDARQMPAAEKRRLASAVLDNDSTVEALSAQLGLALKRLGLA